MSFIEKIDFSDVFEPKSLPGGEVQVRILSIDRKVAQTSGKPYLNVRLDVPSEPTSKDIYVMLSLPEDRDDLKVKNLKKSRLLQFCKAFNYDPSRDGISSDLMAGLTGWAIITEEDDPEYGKRNNVKQWVLPK